MVITRAVVRDRFPVVEAARIYSLLMLVLGVGPILAPSLGAVLVGTLGWRGIFAFLAGFALCCGAAAYVFLPESRHAAARARAQDEALGHSLWAVLTNRLFLGYVLAGGLVNVATFAYIASAPDLLITTYHATMGQFGLAVSAVAAGYIASGPINRVLLRRYSFDRILRMALMASALAAVLLFVIGRMELFGLAGFLVPIGLIVTCLGFVQANALVGAMTSDAHRTGTIAALFGVIQGVLAATGATLAAATHDGTARPVISVILVGLLSALVAHTILVSGRKTVMN
jgi:DHA1 family bicyclomycin/chloramphenicol resistance-like MFS transporter